MNRVLTVSQLNNYIKNVFEDELLLQNISVEGEVFEAKFSGGNSYITLREGDCSLSCVKFGAKFEFAAGDKIRVFGSMRFYPKGGKATFVILSASKVGKGDLLVKLNELKEKLSKEGVFDNAKPLPRLIKKLAIVTSAEGAVIHDFLEVLSRNNCSYIDIDVYGVKVQGLGAEKTIASAINSASSKDYDVLVVARGGGSNQDLDCFNAEIVARSVFESKFPVISAIGHEVDYTLCDFASSLRAGTPSIAAEYIVRNNEAFISSFFECVKRLEMRSDNMLKNAFFAARRFFGDLELSCAHKTSEVKNALISYGVGMGEAVGDKCESMRKTISENLTELQRKTEVKLTERENELKLAVAVLNRTSPLKIISDGYAKVIKDDKCLTDASDVEVGDRLKVVMKGGMLGVTVNEKGVYNNGFGE